MSTTQVDNVIAKKLISAYEDFSFQFLSQLTGQETNENVFISPISVAIALAMTYNGARGTTEQAIARVLGLEGLSLQEINAANRWLLSIGESSDAQLQITFANLLWVTQGILLDDDFVQQLRVAYLSEVASLDFTNPEAAITINRWVAKITQEKVKELIAHDQIKDAILVLINAIYFKGIWTEQFNPRHTRKQPFTLLDGQVKRHPMMSQSGRYFYYEQEKFQAVSLPYGDGRVSMYIFLPQLSSSITEFQTLLTADNWRSWMPRFYEMEGNIELPRFKVNYREVLNNALIGLGIGDAFSGAANFAGMGAGPLMISQVIHEAVIEVNEKGTEAAAATAATMKRGGAHMSFSMIVDSPFFYAIRDNQTSALLFMGFVLNPTT
jgi:serine protease inhibitor